MVTDFTAHGLKIKLKLLNGLRPLYARASVSVLHDGTKYRQILNLKKRTFVNP
jgi:hypothetical protein